MFDRFIPADVFADVPRTAEGVRNVMASLRARIDLDWTNASFDELAAAFAGERAQDQLGELLHDLYEWFPSLQIGGERAELFTLCVWTILEYQVRELRLLD
jgi:hypothetical protein